MIKTSKCSLIVIPKYIPQIQDGRWPLSRKNEKSLYLSTIFDDKTSYDLSPNKVVPYVVRIDVA